MEMSLNKWTFYSHSTRSQCKWLSNHLYSNHSKHNSHPSKRAINLIVITQCMISPYFFLKRKALWNLSKCHCHILLLWKMSLKALTTKAYILASKRKVTKWFVYCFIKLNDIFFLQIVNLMYVVLEWICLIWTKFSEAKLRHVSLNGFARLARYLSLWVLWKPNSRCGRERMFWPSGKSTNFSNEPPTGNTSPCTKHTK